MGKDRRLYAVFTLDFADSHKIAPLSDAAFRAYVRMVLWSRRMLTDGKIPGPMARHLAKPKALAELCSNDPVAPSLRKDGDDYWIHDFLEHQSSKEQVEAAQEASRVNGSKGGRPRKTQTEPGHNPGGYRNGTQTEPDGNTESESKTETTTGHLSQSSPVPARGDGSDGGDESLEALCARQASAMGVDFGKVRNAVGRACGRFPDATGVMRIIATILERATPPVKSPTGLILRAVENDWAEWQQFLDEEAA